MSDDDKIMRAVYGLVLLALVPALVCYLVLTRSAMGKRAHGPAVVLLANALVQLLVLHLWIGKPHSLQDSVELYRTSWFFWAPSLVVCSVRQFFNLV